MRRALFRWWLLCRAARSRRLSCPTLTVTLHPPGPRLSRIPGVTQSSALGQEHSLSHVILNRNVRGLSGGNYLGMRAPRLQQPQPRGHVHMSQDRSTHERSDVPDERLCDASERFARFAGTSMRVPVHGPCIMRTRCVSVDCRQRYPSEISTWYWFCPPAARGASLLAELVRLPRSNVACPGRPSWQRHCQAPFPLHIHVRDCSSLN